MLVRVVKYALAKLVKKSVCGYYTGGSSSGGGYSSMGWGGGSGSYSTMSTIASMNMGGGSGNGNAHSENVSANLSAKQYWCLQYPTLILTQDPLLNDFNQTFIK